MFYWAFERVFVILQTKSSLLQQLEVLGGEEQKERVGKLKGEEKETGKDRKKGDTKGEGGRI